MNKTETIENDRPLNSGDEIDLVEVAKTIWKNRLTVYKAVIIFIVLGLIAAFGSKVEYQSACKLLPDSEENSMSNLGGLGGLAGLAGINLNMNNQGTISPELYPQIVQSIPFQIKSINQKIKFETIDSAVSSYNYFNEIYKPSFLGYIVEYTIYLPNKFRGEHTQNSIFENGENEILRISKEDARFLRKFRDRIGVEVDSKTGVISVLAEMPDPLASAELAKSSVDLLQKYVIDYKISKAKESLKFVKERYNEAKNRFESIQIKLALFNDSNQNVINARVQTERQKLENEYNLAFEVFQGLATQLEQAEIKVKEDTPIFTIVEPVIVPVNKSKPKRKLILASSILLGGIIGVSIILIKNVKL